MTRPVQCVQCLTCAGFSMKTNAATLAKHGFGICSSRRADHAGQQQSAVYARQCATWRLAPDHAQRSAWARKQGYALIDLPFTPPSASLP